MYKFKQLRKPQAEKICKRKHNRAYHNKVAENAG